MKLFDTNALIYFSQGKFQQELEVTGYLISIITEIEILGHKNLTPADEANLKAILGSLKVVPIDEDIKNEAIRLRRTTNLRLPDAIIAATAIVAGAEMLTHDAGVLKISGLKASAPPLLP